MCVIWVTVDHRHPLFAVVLQRIMYYEYNIDTTFTRFSTKKTSHPST